MQANKDNKHIVVGLEDLDSIVDYLKQKMKVCKIFAFWGALGAGKTIIIRRLLRKCGVHGPITSPTFTYLNAYKNDQGESFYHFDLYRIENLKDFLSAGFDEYLYAENSWCFIEWPKVIESLLRDKICHVCIDYLQDPDKRIFTCELK